MVAILWLSRHKPLPKQIQVLNQKFNNPKIIQYTDTVKNADHVIQLIHKFKADEIVTVLPLTVIMHLVQRGIKPLWAEMEALPPEKVAEADYVFQFPFTGILI